jgi:hypothetical protein
MSRSYNEQGILVTQKTEPSTLGNTFLSLFDKLIYGNESTLVIPRGTITLTSNMVRQLVKDLHHNEDESLITRVIIPKSIVTIGGGAFLRFQALETVVLPPGLKSIGQGAFLECQNLTSICIPSGVTEIGNGAFMKCANLAYIEIPDRWQTNIINNSEFRECYELERISSLAEQSVEQWGRNNWRKANGMELEIEFAMEPEIEVGVGGIAMQPQFDQASSPQFVQQQMPQQTKKETAPSAAAAVWAATSSAAVRFSKSSIGLLLFKVLVVLCLWGCMFALVSTK